MVFDWDPSLQMVIEVKVTVPPGKETCKVAAVFLKYKDLGGRTNRETRSACAVSYTPHRDEMVASK